MANVFPLLSSGSMQAFVKSPLSTQALAQYPAGFSHQFVTRVNQFLDDSEQRWVTRTELLTLVLKYHGVAGYDYSLIRDFFNSMSGGYVDADLINTFSITIDNVQYDWCCFVKDEIEAVTNRAEFYSFELSIRQLAPNSATG
jgi:hypothetical protein